METAEIQNKLKDLKLEYGIILAAISPFYPESVKNTALDHADKVLAEIDRLERTLAVREWAHEIRVNGGLQ